MRSIILLLVLAWAPLTWADIRNYRCQTYIDNRQILEADPSIRLEEVGVDHVQAMGFAQGVFYGSSRLTPSIAARKQLRIFEAEIEKQCRAKPKSRFQDIVIELAARMIEHTSRQSVLQPNSGEYRTISLTDLRLDIKQLIGQRIEVPAFFQSMGEIAMISEGVFDMNKMPVDTDKLSRDTRKFIIENCGSGCRVKLRGKVANLVFGEGIAAEDLTPE